MKRWFCYFLVVALLFTSCSKADSSLKSVDEVEVSDSSGETATYSKEEQFHIYKSFLQEFQDEYEDSGLYSYLLYDVNKDGILELLMEYYPDHVGETGILYTIQNGVVEEIGELSTYSYIDIIGYEDSLVVTHAFQNSYWATQVKLYKGEIVETELEIPDYTLVDETSAIPTYQILGLDTNQFLSLEFEHLNHFYNLAKATSNESFVLSNLSISSLSDGTIKLSGEKYINSFSNSDEWGSSSFGHRKYTDTVEKESVILQEGTILNIRGMEREENYKIEEREQMMHTYLQPGYTAEISLDENGNARCIRVWFDMLFGE